MGWKWQHNQTMCNTAAHNLKKRQWPARTELAREKFSPNTFVLRTTATAIIHYSTLQCLLQPAHEIPSLTTIQIVEDNCQIIPSFGLNRRKKVVIRQNLLKKIKPPAQH